MQSLRCAEGCVNEEPWSGIRRNPAMKKNKEYLPQIQICSLHSGDRLFFSALPCLLRITSAWALPMHPGSAAQTNTPTPAAATDAPRLGDNLFFYSSQITSPLENILLAGKSQVAFHSMTFRKNAGPTQINRLTTTDDRDEATLFSMGEGGIMVEPVRDPLPSAPSVRESSSV